jgi:CheY-like chemotaxis protein
VKVPDSLQGRLILVVEDDFLIGYDFATSLEGLGAKVLGPVGSVDDALDLLLETVKVDAAVLDLNLGGELSYPVADALAERGIPFVFTTGYDKAKIAARFSAVTHCEKPVDISKVVQALLK